MYALIFLLALPVFAANYALIVGGAAHENQNEFLGFLSEEARVLAAKGWKTSVLYDSDFRPSEWNRFPASTRPQHPGQKDHHFSHANYNREMDELIAHARPGDQVSISFNAHGGVINNKHRIDWHDARGHWEATNLAHSLVDAFDPTVNVFNKVEELLKKGVKVHFNLLSCYDGQILKDVRSLLQRYPNTLCISTTTASDHESHSSAELYLQTIRARSSVEESFRNSPESDANISSIPHWNDSESSLIVDEGDDLDPFHQLCRLNASPALKLEVTNLMRGILSAYPEAKGQKGSLRLREACSNHGRSVMNEIFRREDDRLLAKYHATPFNVTYAEAPSYFDFHEGYYFPAGGGSGYRIHGPKNALTLPVDFESILNAKEFEPKAYHQLLAKVRQHPAFATVFQQFLREHEALKNSQLSRTCSYDSLDKIVSDHKNRLLNNPNRPRACSNFRY